MRHSRNPQLTIAAPLRSATTGTHMSKDPTDAAQVPPSVMRKTLGDPVVEHDDHLHARDERHRRASAQEDFRVV